MITASEKYDYCLILSWFEADHFLKMYEHKEESDTARILEGLGRASNFYLISAQG